MRRKASTQLQVEGLGALSFCLRNGWREFLVHGGDSSPVGRGCEGQANDEDWPTGNREAQSRTHLVSTQNTASVSPRRAGLLKRLHLLRQTEESEPMESEARLMAPSGKLHSLKDRLERLKLHYGGDKAIICR